jgi:hypothetical protein
MKEGGALPIQESMPCHSFFNLFKESFGNSPRLNLVRYSGVFAPSSSWRWQIIPARPAEESAGASNKERAYPAHHHEQEFFPTPSLLPNFSMMSGAALCLNC